MNQLVLRAGDVFTVVQQGEELDVVALECGETVPREIEIPGPSTLTRLYRAGAFWRWSSGSSRASQSASGCIAMMWWSDAGWGAGSWLAMSVMMVLFWGGLIALGVWLVRRARISPSTDQVQSATVDPDRVLAERFARGEIDDAEFTRSRTILHPPSDRV